MEPDDAPRPGDPLTLLSRYDLDPLSVAELDVRLAALERETERTAVKREQALNHRTSADAIFR